MIAVQETTEWKEPTPNHIYFLSNDKSKMHSYINVLTGEHKIFTKPIGFDQRGRTFKILKKVDSKRD